MKTTRLQSIDGWRAVSIILVLGGHLHFSNAFPAADERVVGWFFDGNWGVRFFFVISGFLITHLLLQEHAKNGFISLRHFYLRRAYRILPVCIAYLIVLGVFTQYSQSASMWLANFTFTTNFVETHHPSPTTHLWSLGVEEQ